ncbi:Hypothetical protein LUCI_2298 [Lucifera butyrica]|uniref:Alanine racemase N-terminal domain-containing protein n=1 Tax=Lucifera butyrica TaxID=1351585 RepID=A0A498R6E9_9FIRM|nr:alanine/ornithine racemase family PLP-dependent enzyme [Lucifera butyrica]VBB07054.1 Hypothetical protein LUCI_2298 [Lucifera butyrica]
MEVSPALEVDLDKLQQNAARVVEKCHQQGIEVLGVTKGFSAIPEIVAALVAGGVDGLADSRMENILELHKGAFNLPITLLRIPRLSNVDSVVQDTDISVNSEITVIKALSEAALKRNRVHKVLLMVDVGDLREGILTENVLCAVKDIVKLKGVRLVGLGTNMGCFGGVLPSSNNLGTLVKLVEAVERCYGIQLEVVSGGGTSSLLLVEKQLIPAGVNQLRIGEGILLGTDTTNSRKIPWLHQDAFRLLGEVIEVKSKPSVPIGRVGRDAFGNIPQFVDRGIRKRAILALGKQDIYIEGITPVDENITIMGASSDHLIVDITEARQKVRVGDEMEFFLTYAGLLSVCNSRYVGKIYIGGGHD